MKKIISIFLILFLLVAAMPSAGYCEDEKKGQSTEATIAAAKAGKEAGKATFLGLSAGTIAIGAVIIAGILIAVIGSGGSSTTSYHY